MFGNNFLPWLNFITAQLKTFIYIHIHTYMLPLALCVGFAVCSASRLPALCFTFGWMSMVFMVFVHLFLFSGLHNGTVSVILQPLSLSNHRQTRVPAGLQQAFRSRELLEGNTNHRKCKINNGKIENDSIIFPEGVTHVQPPVFV